MNAIIIDDDDACREILVQLISHVDSLELTGSFSRAKDALKALKDNDVHIVFLDVEMPEMTGLELLSSLEIKPQVILTTSHKKYAFDAFDYEVVDYLLKPITLPRFLKAVEKAGKNLEKSINKGMVGNKEYFFIKSDSIINKVFIKDVLWIEALGDYVKIHTPEKSYVLHITLKALESKLPADKFARVHRSHIVQLDNVKNVQDTSIYVGDLFIPLGALYKENFLKKLNLLT